MKYQIDSDWVADWLAGRRDAVPLLTELSPDGLAISLITFGEIYEGVYYGRDPQRAMAGLTNFVGNVRVLPLNRAILIEFAKIRGELRRTGRIIGDMDILIAATAIHHNLILVTRNIRDFERIPNLQLYRPVEFSG